MEVIGLGVRIKGTLENIDPLNQVLRQRARSTWRFMGSYK